MTRAERRHYLWRAKHRAWRYARDVMREREHWRCDPWRPPLRFAAGPLPEIDLAPDWFGWWLGQKATTRTPCSEWCCGNPRRHFGEPTLRERRQDAADRVDRRQE